MDKFYHFEDLDLILQSGIPDEYVRSGYQLKPLLIWVEHSVSLVYPRACINVLLSVGQDMGNTVNYLYS